MLSAGRGAIGRASTTILAVGMALAAVATSRADSTTAIWAGPKTGKTMTLGVPAPYCAQFEDPDRRLTVSGVFRMKRTQDGKAIKDGLVALDLACRRDSCVFVWVELDSWNFTFIGNEGSARQETLHGVTFQKDRIVVHGLYRGVFPFTVEVEKRSQEVKVTRTREYGKSASYPAGTTFPEEGHFNCDGLL